MRSAWPPSVRLPARSSRSTEMTGTKHAAIWPEGVVEKIGQNSMKSGPLPMWTSLRETYCEPTSLQSLIQMTLATTRATVQSGSRTANGNAASGWMKAAAADETAGCAIDGDGCDGSRDERPCGWL